MYVTGSGTIGDLLGDMVAYRSLRPFDPRLAHFQAPSVIPRKIETAYARAVSELLRAARRVDAPAVELRRLIAVGDNRASDGAAFDNLCAVNDWTGAVLIVDERPEALPLVDEQARAGTHTWSLTRWSQLYGWAAGPGKAAVDETTAVLLDVDKTLIGARGRNDAVVDEARSAAMRAVCVEILGPAFDVDAFEYARQVFNDRTYHRLTGDNQDYVAYICLVCASGAIAVAELAAEVQRGRVTTPADLVAAFDAKIGRDATSLRAMHRTISERISQGDPTPFKEFRVREYEETVARMGHDRTGDITELLRTEIVLTGEVLEVAREWKRQGALLFALSDKPDEAATPPEPLAAQGYRPLHWTRTPIVAGLAHSPSSRTP